MAKNYLPHQSQLFPSCSTLGVAKLAELCFVREGHPPGLIQLQPGAVHPPLWEFWESASFEVRR